MKSPLSLPQYLSAAAVSWCATVVGGWVSFTSVAIPKMMTTTEEEEEFLIDLNTGSWIISILSIGLVAGCLVGGYINQRIGARRIFLYSAPLACLTWVLIAVSPSTMVVLVSRFLSGVLFGVYQATCKVYNAEIAHPDMRGSLGTIISNMYALGSLYTYILGSLIQSWRIIAWLQIIPCFLLGVSVFFVPDSPYWLVERGREEDARTSLKILRGSGYNVEPELVEIINKKRSKEEHGRSVVQTLCSQEFFWPFLRLGSLMMLTQWAGMNVVTAYMVNIFMMSGTSIHPELAPVLVSSIQQLLAMISTLVLRVSPRKPLFLLCSTIIAMAHTCMGTFSYLTMQDTEPGSSYGWVPILCVVSVTASQTIGFMAVVQLLMAESFPTEIRFPSGLNYSSCIKQLFSGVMLLVFVEHLLLSTCLGQPSFILYFLKTLDFMEHSGYMEL